VGKAGGASLSGIKGRIRAVPALVQDARLQSLRHDIPLMKNLALGEAADGCTPVGSRPKKGLSSPTTAKIAVKKKRRSAIMASGHYLISYKYY